MNDLISRKSLIENLNTFAPEQYTALVNMLILKEPAVDVMTANEYQKLAARTINKSRSMKEAEYHALHEMAAEIGELHGIYQKFYQGHIATEEHKKKETGDILWGIAEYCTANGWELEDIMRLNIEKLKARYPDGFDSEKSLHRKEGDI